jgi:putative oxygen-independent coproporphyrinogen III oxidase
MPGVYVSFPFCAQKCSFCNFASGAFSRELEHQYNAALLTEVCGHVWQWTPDTVYFGGGTPSNMDPDALCRVLAAIPGRPWREATLEAAPGTITREKADAWRSMGINRVSLGVQSFVASELKQTGRRHDAQMVVRDCEVLRSVGIENINIDLIAGLPYQTPESWAESLDWIGRLDPPHVSVYMFEIDEDSRLGFEILNNGHRYGASEIPSEDASADSYETAVDRLGSLGVERYEISNFAKRGYESLHNLKYWRMEPYTGFGSDAHSFDGRERRENVESAQEYVTRMQEGATAVVNITPSNRDEERMFTGLRLAEGISLSSDDWQRHRKPIERFIEAGLLERGGEKLRLTRRGVLLSNEVFQEFLAA